MPEKAQPPTAEAEDKSTGVLLALAVAIILFSCLLGVLWTTEPAYPGGLDALSNFMFSYYSGAFVFIAIILVAAMLGGIYIAKEEARK